MHNCTHGGIRRLLLAYAGWATCSALAKEHGGQLSREHVTDALRAAGIGENGEVTDLLWTEMGLAQNAPITKVECLLCQLGAQHEALVVLIPLTVARSSIYACMQSLLHCIKIRHTRQDCSQPSFEAEATQSLEPLHSMWTGCCRAQDAWEGLMVQFSRRYAERQANMFVVCATTPAQVFHALRRQMNRHSP